MSKYEEYQEALNELKTVIHDEFDGTKLLNSYLEKIETLQELIDKEKVPTLEECIKEWEALGWKVIENCSIRIKLKSSLSTIQISKIKKVYRKVIGKEENNIGNFLTLQEHQLITKTMKALGWI